MPKLLFAALALGAALTATAAMAATQTFTATLTGASETPPNTSPGTGAATATLDTATKTFSWKVEYSGLTGPATMAHFHGPAAPGVAAGVAVPITGPMASPLVGSATLTDPQIADLEAGKWYVNVHTAQFPKGEIRGQVMSTH
jgi:ABC-type transport system substrate-binding protein